MKRSPLIPIFCFLALIASTAPARAIDRTDQVNLKLEKLRNFGMSKATKGCSKAGKVTTSPVANRHDPVVTDQIERIVCPGLDIRYYVAYTRSPPARIPDSVEVTGANMQLPFGLKTGAPRLAIERMLGVPDLSLKDAITYYAPEGEAGGRDGITFLFERDRLVKFGVGFHYD